MRAVAKRIGVSLANHIDLILLPNREILFPSKQKCKVQSLSGGIFWPISSGSVSASQQSHGQKLTR